MVQILLEEYRVVKVNGREIVHYTEDQLWNEFNHPHYRISVDCEDGTSVDTTGRALLLTWYGLRIHRSFPAMRVRSSHILATEVFSGKIQQDLTSALLFDCWDDINGAMTPGEIAIHIQVIVMDWYNAYVSRMSRYVMSLSALDFLEICTDERAVRSMAEAKPTEDSIAEVYRVHTEIVTDADNRYPDNNVVKSMRPGVMKRDQLMQNISVRGNVTDYDSNIFRNSIMSGFFRGFTKLEDVMKERCSAVKALSMSKAPLSATEYLNRRIQLVATVITNLIRGHGRTLYSCSNFRTIPFTISKSNRKNIEGKHWVDIAGIDHIFDPTDNTLLGKVINLRSPLGCGHRHEGRVCGKCLGEISWSIEEQDNLGQQASMELCPLTSQSVLSTKHLDMSSTLSAVSFPTDYEQTIRPSAGLGARFTKRVNRGCMMVIPFASLPHPNDLNLAGEGVLINPLHFSTVDKFTLVFTQGGDQWEEKFNIAMDKVSGFFSSAFLEHIKVTGLEVDIKGNYRIDLSKWTVQETVFMYPRRHRNMIDFMKATAGMLESTGKDNVKLSDFTTEGEALAVFSDLIYSTFDVNIAHLEILILSVLARNPAAADHRIPTVDEPHYFGNVRDNIANRSLSGKFAFQGQIEALHAPSSYVNRDRMSVPMDWLFG